MYVRELRKKAAGIFWEKSPLLQPPAHCIIIAMYHYCSVNWSNK